MSVVFFGSSEFSLASLKACLDSGIPVTLVVTTPDTKKGRGLQSSPTPVKVFAESHQLPVIAPEKLRLPELVAEVEKIRPDYFVVASYGKLIPPAWLKIPQKLSINVHPSLLPKYRGAAPINWPILNGDAETGLCLIEVVDKLDAGDIFYTRKIPITAQDTSLTLSLKLSDLSYEAVKELLGRLQKGESPKRTPQNEAEMTYARKLVKEDGAVNWSMSANEIFNKCRGLLPWPMAYFGAGNDAVQILKCSVESGSGKPGEVRQISRDTLKIQTGKDILVLERVRPAGKKEMSGADFARGRRLAEGAML